MIDIPACYRSITVLLALTVLPLSGCIGGPRALRLSRSKFNRAILQTDKEAMLLNLVRLRYREPVEFLEVGGIAEQFSFSGEGDVVATLPDVGSDVLGLSLRGSASERPTLTYTPQHGEEFNRRLLSPISIETMSLLSLTGWPLDTVLRLTVQSINDLYNEPTLDGQLRHSGEQFNVLAQAVRQLQAQKQVEIVYATLDPAPVAPPLPRSQLTGTDLVAAADAGYSFRSVDSSEDGDERWQLYSEEQPTMVMRIDPLALQSPEVATIVQLLRLSEPRSLYEIEPGAEGQLQHRVANRLGTRETLTIGRRTFLEMLLFLSNAVSVPGKHMEQGLVEVLCDASGTPIDPRQVTGDLLRIDVASGHRPPHAAVAVPYGGHWFYIADNDLRSKATFALVMEIYGIELRGGGGFAVPVLTLGLD